MALLTSMASGIAAARPMSTPFLNSLKIESTASSVVVLSRRSRSISIRAAEEANAASATDDSIVSEVAALPEAGDTVGVAGKKKVSPLEKGGTLSGNKAAGKDPGAAALGKSLLSAEGKFSDPRWKNGTWDVEDFKSADGKVNWDAMIDAEVIRRQLLEESPEGSTNEEPVVFETSVIPWWAWVRRFHLPEAEKLNGRAAMVGYSLGYLVDSATGAGLVDQTDAFLGKLLILATIVGVLVVRRVEDIENIRSLAEEWTFYDKQWQATWKEGPPPAGSEEVVEEKKSFF